MSLIALSKGTLLAAEAAAVVLHHRHIDREVLEVEDFLVVVLKRDQGDITDPGAAKGIRPATPVGDIPAREGQLQRAAGDEVGVVDAPEDQHDQEKERADDAPDGDSRLVCLAGFARHAPRSLSLIAAACAARDEF
ncbi:MAG: hypothetical protein IPQ17_13285 [Xanthomonadales bacterium]|nr:hypothetical protein [Xanthomonadales bacterium]